MKLCPNPVRVPLAKSRIYEMLRVAIEVMPPVLGVSIEDFREAKAQVLGELRCRAKTNQEKGLLPPAA